MVLRADPGRAIPWFAVHSSAGWRVAPARSNRETMMNRHRILVAYDGSEASFWALQQAADAAERDDAELGVVTVMPRLVDAPRDALSYLDERGIVATLHSPVGDPATEIARVADAGAYHTVYLGVRDGSVARALASDGPGHLTLRAPSSLVLAR